MVEGAVEDGHDKGRCASKLAVRAERVPSGRGEGGGWGEDAMGCSLQLAGIGPQRRRASARIARRERAAHAPSLVVAADDRGQDELAAKRVRERERGADLSQLVANQRDVSLDAHPTLGVDE